jgi:hypothetical protein
MVNTKQIVKNTDKIQPPRYFYIAINKYKIYTFIRIYVGKDQNRKVVEIENASILIPLRLMVYKDLFFLLLC